MRYILLTLLVVATSSCERSKMFDADAATKWSKTADVQMRQKACFYIFNRPDGSLVAISTSTLRETTAGFIADGSGMLETGYLVYPGGQRASSIDEAIDFAYRIPHGLAHDAAK